MAHFVEPINTTFLYESRGTIYTGVNYPINLEKVTTHRVNSGVSWGEQITYNIVFYFDKDNTEIWRFNSEATRDFELKNVRIAMGLDQSRSAYD